jgi:hypothetical protein
MAAPVTNWNDFDVGTPFASCPVPAYDTVLYQRIHPKTDDSHSPHIRSGHFSSDWYEYIYQESGEKGRPGAQVGEIGVPLTVESN